MEDPSLRDALRDHFGDPLAPFRNLFRRTDKSRQGEAERGRLVPIDMAVRDTVTKERTNVPLIRLESGKPANTVVVPLLATESLALLHEIPPKSAKAVAAMAQRAGGFISLLTSTLSKDPEDRLWELQHMLGEGVEILVVCLPVQIDTLDHDAIPALLSGAVERCRNDVTEAQQGVPPRVFVHSINASLGKRLLNRGIQYAEAILIPCDRRDAKQIVRQARGRQPPLSAILVTSDPQRHAAELANKLGQTLRAQKPRAMADLHQKTWRIPGPLPRTVPPPPPPYNSAEARELRGKLR